MKNRHIASLLFGVPLAIDQVKLDAILAGIGDRFDLDLEAGPTPTGAPAQRKPYAMQNGVAVIDVFASLSQRSLPMAAMSGITSYAELSAELQKAVADPECKAILMRFDSPGGEVAGMFDMADQIAAARGVKPIVALAEDKALSAAYLLAAACDKVYVTQSGDAGSIGIVSSFVDTSMADAQQGKRVTYIAAGARKLDGAPPIQGSAAWKALEGRVAEAYDLFVGKVAAMRGMTQDAVRATEAGVFRGKKAVSAGLADGVASFAQVLAMLADDDGDDDLAADAEPDEDDGPQMALFGSTDARIVRTLATAPSGAITEVAMGDPMKKDPAAGGDGGAELLALRARVEAAEKETATLRLKAELDQKALEATAKNAIIKRHQERGALVPAMLAGTLKLAEVMTAEELDKTLSGYPVQSILSPVATAPAGANDVGAKHPGESGTFELDAQAQKLARTFGWEASAIEKFAGIQKIQMAEGGAIAIMADGKRVPLKDLNGGRA